MMQQSTSHVFMSPVLQGRVKEKEAPAFSRAVSIHSPVTGFKFYGPYSNLLLAHKHFTLHGKLDGEFPAWLFDTIGSNVHVSVNVVAGSTVDRLLELTQVQVDVNEGIWMITGEILTNEK